MQRCPAAVIHVRAIERAQTYFLDIMLNYFLSPLSPFHPQRCLHVFCTRRLDKRSTQEKPPHLPSRYLLHRVLCLMVSYARSVNVKLRRKCFGFEVMPSEGYRSEKSSPTSFQTNQCPYSADFKIPPISLLFSSNPFPLGVSSKALHVCTRCGARELKRVDTLSLGVHQAAKEIMRMCS